MAIKDYFFNATESGGEYDREYNAEDITSYLDKVVSSGVLPKPSTNLQVVATGGMNITVKAGQGFIDGHKMINTADMPLVVSSPDVVLDRIDRVIFYVDYNTRTMGIEILEGTPAVSPSAPALTRTENRVEYSLATIRVVKQATAITQTNITDTRADSSVCGWVQGLIQQVDTETLFVQWQTAYQEFFNQLRVWEEYAKSDFQSWLISLADELTVETYIQEFHKYQVIETTASKIVILDMENYSYRNGDVFFVAINGLVATEGVDYEIYKAIEPPRLYLNIPDNRQVKVDVKILRSQAGFFTAIDSNADMLVTSNGDNIIFE